MHVERRDDFMRKMAGAGIAVRRVQERNVQHSCFAELGTELPGLEATGDLMICIPVGWWVTEADRAHIVDTIRAGW
jgi:hypothetical protein